MAATQAGLRERKKEQTRRLIFDVARKLFESRGFDEVTVAEIARAADVSEVTVFNYFPTKEDLFYGGMQFFEEQLLEAVRTRPRGDTPLHALRRTLLEGAGGLAQKERIASVLRSGKMIAASPALAAREREIVELYTHRLADLLAEETGARPDDIEPRAMAAALIATHRAVVAETRRRVAGGLRGEALVTQVRAMVRRAYGRLERGLGDYDVRR